MVNKESYAKHYEESTVINSSAKNVFFYADDHRNFSSHMNQSSWMMGGGKMETTVDAGKGQKVGSHIRMSGNVFGINLFLDEVVVQHDPPYRKAWETVGDLNLLVIDHYKLGFQIEPDNIKSKLKIYIDYSLPKSCGARVLGYLLGEIYAKWCVNRMISGVKDHFRSK